MENPVIQRVVAPKKLTRFGVLSRRWFAHVLAIIFLSAGLARAHEVRPSVADVMLGSVQFEMTIRLSAEALLSGIDLSAVVDTNEAPEAAEYDALRLLEPEEIESRLRSAWPELARGFLVDSSEPVTLHLDDVRISPVGDPALPRDSGLLLSGVLPDDGSPVTVGWIAAYGPLVVRQGEGDAAYSAYLQGGELSAPLPREGVATESMGGTVVRYVVLGFEHIVPKGLDHILFVLGLFFFSLAMRPLLVQVTAFTLAHTVTLALASLQIVSVSPGLVEPLIAASITYVAIENVLRPKLGWWRTAVVFGFGLLHGLGFASVLSDIGLEPTRFIVGLVSFNVGVELGQLAVISAAFLLLGFWFGQKSWYRSRIAVPLSAAIAFVGAYWFVERVFL